MALETKISARTELKQRYYVCSVPHDASSHTIQDGDARSFSQVMITPTLLRILLFWFFVTGFAVVWWWYFWCMHLYPIYKDKVFVISPARNRCFLFLKAILLHRKSKYFFFNHQISEVWVLFPQSKCSPCCSWLLA